MYGYSERLSADEVMAYFEAGRITPSEACAGLVVDRIVKQDLDGAAATVMMISAVLPLEARSVKKRLPAMLVNFSETLGALDDLDGFEVWKRSHKDWADAVVIGAETGRLESVVRGMGANLREFCAERRERQASQRH